MLKTIIEFVVNAVLAIVGGSERQRGRSETEAAQSKEEIKNAKEAANVRDQVDRMPSDAAADELQQWTKPSSPKSGGDK